MSDTLGESSYEYHVRRAAECLAVSDIGIDDYEFDQAVARAGHAIAAAQVHATLALAAATRDRREQP